MVEYSVFESPIEAILAWAIACHPSNVSGDDVYIRDHIREKSFEDAVKLFDHFCVTCGSVPLHGPRPLAVICPQTQIGTARVDLLVLARDWYGHPDHSRPTVAFVVECDGHDFHEKTKAQAARDKARDRRLATSRLHVLRFTGSEIVKDPPVCAEQVWQFIRSHT